MIMNLFQDDHTLVMLNLFQHLLPFSENTIRQESTMKDN